MLLRFGKYCDNTPLTILDLKQRQTGIKIAKMSNDNGCIPLCNNGTL